MTHLSRRPKGLLTVLQILTAVVAILGTWFESLLYLLGFSAAREMLAEASTPLGAKTFVVCALATVVGVSACCYIVLWSFATLLQRMKKETAFTQRNCRALGRMSLGCAAAAAILFTMMSYIAFGVFVPTRSFTGSVWQFVETLGMLMLWPFGFGLVSLLIQGVRVLMARALALREEQELVV